LSIYRVIDKLEAYIKDGTALPLKYRVLSEERLVEFIEKMRSTLPEEVGRAKLIARDKDRVLREAQERAQSIVTEASTAHAALIDDHEIVRQAKRTADAILREAEERARRVMGGADAYAAHVLSDLEQRLTTVLGSVKKGVEALGAGRGESPAPLADAAAKSKRVAFDTAAEQTLRETAELESVHIT
jgi:cell division septum initiation protein DivIVA